MTKQSAYTRRDFVKSAGAFAVASAIPSGSLLWAEGRRRYAIVGTGVRGVGMWGRDLTRRYSDVTLGVSCPTFINFDQMCDTAKPDLLMVTNFGKSEKVPVPKAGGGHGGGDDRLRELIFRKVDAPDYLRLPDSRASARSCLTGIAARKSVEEHRPIRIRDLVRI